MNLEQSDSFKNELERNARSKKNVVLSLVFCAFLVILLIVLIAFLSYIDSVTEKLFVDDAQVTIPNNFYKVIDGERYVNLKALSDLLGYNYTKGVYGEYNEDEDSCYMNNNFEIVAVTAGSQKYDKYLELGNDEITIAPFEEVLIKNDIGYSESFNIEKPIKFEDGILYAPQEYISQMFNMQVDWQEYRIKLYTTNYLIAVAQNTMKAKGLTQMSNYYENIKALNYGYIVVGDSQTEGKDAESEFYGVIDLMDGHVVISLKYDEIVFVQNSQEFYITAANGTVGILDSKGQTVIAPSEFEKISLLDAEKKLYLVEKNMEYGVLDKQGNILIYAEYDNVGLDIKDFVKEEVENQYLFFDKCIPVEKEGKFGLYDINGNRLLDPVYDGFGYKTEIKSTSSGSEQSTLLIPSYVGINGIVINLNDKYGIFDVNTGGLILPTVFDKVYSIKREGERTYYVSYNEQELELSQYLKEQNLNNVDESGRFLTETNSVVEPDIETEPVADAEEVTETQE